MARKLPEPIHRFIKTTSFWKDNALILRELRHFPKIVFLAVLFPLLAAVFDGFGIGFLLGFLQNLVNDGEPFKTGLEWFDLWILGSDKPELERLYRISGLILASTWMKAYLSYFSNLYARMAEIKLVNRLYKQIFEQLQALGFKFYSTTRSGVLLNTLTTEVNQLRQAISSIGFIISKGSTLIVYAFIALRISWPLSLMAIFLFSMSATGFSAFNKKIREASFQVTSARENFISLASEFINGIRTVKTFSAQDYERKRHHRANQLLVEKMTAAAKQESFIRPLAEGAATTILIFMIIVSMAIFVSNEVLQVASLLTFLFVLFRLVPALQQLVSVFSGLNRFQGPIESIQELLRTDNKPYLPDGSRSFPGLKHAIEFVDMDFGYDDDSLVLHNITLTIEKGKTTALVGASGAGKSTLADLIPRFYDPTAGRILLDGVDLREFKIDSIRRKMAVVSQDTFIFNTTARSNISYGSENATDEEIYEAARLANAMSFIQELPQGFDTILGDRGIRLSGGQRQRIAIARALLRNPEILILDEATSALDSVSEQLIQESIDKISVGRTVIAIAHRLSTIKNADKVIVMEQGRTVEQGSYQDLLSQRGELWKYHQMQNQPVS